VPPDIALEPSALLKDERFSPSNRSIFESRWAPGVRAHGFPCENPSLIFTIVHTLRSGIVDDRHARAVFFVSDGERSLHFYTEKLGFKVDWKFEYEGRADVFQVKLHGFALILNQGYAETEARVGQGRVFIGLDDGEQTESLRRHIEERAIETTVEHWESPLALSATLMGMNRSSGPL
jgi:hypothetical protein